MKLRLLLSVFFAFLAFASCSSNGSGCDDDDCPEPSSSSGGGDGSGSWTGWPFDSSGETLQTAPECPSYDNPPIEIRYSNGGSPDITNPYESDVSIDKNGENVTLTLSGETEHNLVLSGTAKNGSLKVFSDTKMRLYLNGVNIKNSSGPAINIQKAQKGKTVNVCLMSGTENYLDGASLAVPDGQEQAKGAFFSEKKLYFTGNGSLEVKARRGNPEASGHAIVVDNDFEIDNGKITISEAEGDGIHVNDIIEIKGGVIKIASKGDAIQSEKFGSAIYPSVIISGGKILAKTTGIKSHGITSESPINIEGNAIIQISVLGNGSKGIKSTNEMVIKGGTIAIQVSGGRDHDDADTSTAAGIKVGVTDVVNADLFIDGGNITIKSPGSSAKGINVSKNIDMRSGSVNVEADDDGIKVHGTLNMRGGSITAVSRKSDAIDGVVNKTGGTINGN